jgi:predicted MFS family arabinose efflux permease
MLYSFATSAVSLMLVRVIHGGFYVLMAASCVAAVVGFIDTKHSGQAFGLLAVITIVPYAVVPPLAEILRRVLPSYTQLLAVTGLAILLVIPLVLLVPSPKNAVQQTGAMVGWKEARQFLTDRHLIFLLLSALLMYMPFTAIFYFLNSFALSLNIVDAGLFFTVATSTEIGIRIVFGRYFDLLSKNRLLGVALILLAAAYYVLTWVTGLSGLLVLAVAFGTGWGLAMPMVNAILFDLSKPEMRSFATNLGYEVFQGGFFLGPFAGAWMVQTFGYGGLFITCAGACLAGAAFMLFFERDSAAKQREAAQL